MEKTSSADDVIITSRGIQKVITNLNGISLVIPELCEHLIGFVNENVSIVNADTAAYLLFYLFSMGYEPYTNSEFAQLSDGGDGGGKSESSLTWSDQLDFNHFAEIINRDFDLLPAWLIVQACLALSFYQSLTIDLMHRVFNVEFFARLEKELSFDSVTYNFSILYIRDP